jgi:hypothetical protein
MINILITVIYTIAKNVLIALASYKPYVHRVYQNNMYIYIAEESKSDLTTNPKGYLETLMRVSEKPSVTDATFVLTQLFVNSF